MFNVLEVTTVKARTRQTLALVGLAAGVASVAAPVEVAAQGGSTRQPDANTPRIMVPALRGSEKNVGVQAADAIRSRLSQDIPYRSLWVLPKSDIVATLEASGYPPNEPLAPNDAQQLARLLRADEYLEGTVTKTGSGFRVESRLVLARDNSLVQPLAPAEGARLDLVAKSLSAEVQAARKQLDAERKCVSLARENKYAEAVAAAQAGIAAYPQSTLARACVLQAYSRMNLPADSIIRVSREILAIYPNFRPALQLVARAYREKGDTSASIQSWSTLLASSPNDPALVENVVTEIAGSGRAAVAVPIIDKAVTENPGDPRLLDLQFRLKFVAKDFKGAVQAAEEIAKLDTAMMDTTYFTRLAAAQLSDSQPQRASEVMARAVAKFPQHAPSWLFLAQTQRTAGQLQQAVTSVQRALSLDPSVERGTAQLVQLQMDANQPDSAFATMRRAGLDPKARNCVTTAADSTKAEWATGCKRTYGETFFLSQYALSLGNTQYKAAGASKNVADYRTAVRWLALSDSIAESDQAKFLMGAAFVQMSQPLLQEAQKTKSCEQAREANVALVQSQPLLMRGGKFAPQAAAQLIPYAQQLLPYSEQATKAYCKGS
jgi:cytochrome c-type biogenesis protein CcmH/NrfG